MTIPVVGTDGVSPVYDENSTFRIWAVKDIYLGLEGTRRFVPKVDDYVREPKTYETWIVQSVDPITFIPTLIPIRSSGSAGEMGEDDILFGVGPGNQAQLLRVYINRATNPYKMTVDTHCFVGGTQNAYAVIYKGGDPTVGGEPVSRMYDNSGNFIGAEVPLELVSLDSHTNHSIKIIQECWTTTDIEDGEALYVVIYSSGGNVQSKVMLLAENTTYVRGLDIQRKYVTGISLESPWLAASDANVLRFPLNIPLDALDLVGVVNYNNGEVLRLPVNGTKFSMAGLDGYISSIPGEKFDLTLIYSLSSDEISYAGQGNYVERKVTAPYSVITQVVEPGYTVKLLMFPSWDAASNRYRIRYWLYNLTRNSFLEVTDLVAYSPSQPVFDPRGYGFKQRVQVNLNLRHVSMSYKPMIHTQMFEVTLFSEPQPDASSWLVTTQVTPNRPGYGFNVFAKRIGVNQYNLASGRLTKAEWINDLYNNIDPLVDRRSEAFAPVPIHFWVSTNNGGTWTQYFIDDSWNKNLVSATPLNTYADILVRWTRPSGVGHMELGISSMIIRP